MRTHVDFFLHSVIKKTTTTTNNIFISIEQCQINLSQLSNEFTFFISIFEVSIEDFNSSNLLCFIIKSSVMRIWFYHFKQTHKININVRFFSFFVFQMKWFSIIFNQIEIKFRYIHAILMC